MQTVDLFGVHYNSKLGVKTLYNNIELATSDYYYGFTSSSDFSLKKNPESRLEVSPDLSFSVLIEGSFDPSSVFFIKQCDTILYASPILKILKDLNIPTNFSDK